MERDSRFIHAPAVVRRRMDHCRGAAPVVHCGVEPFVAGKGLRGHSGIAAIDLLLIAVGLA
jgi:hypothetical protein